MTEQLEQSQDNFVKCSICKKKIYDGDGRFNLPQGITKCMDCYEKIPEKKSKYIMIAGFKIPSKLLWDYADKVEQTRKSAVMGSRMKRPDLITKALNDRVSIHKEICKITGYDHEDTSKKAMKVRNALDDWLNKNTFYDSQENGLI